MNECFTQADRIFLEWHFRAIAGRLIENRAMLSGGSRRFWSIEIEGCVYHFDVAGYAKEGSEIHKERKAEALAAAEKFESEYGPALDRMIPTRDE